MPHGGQGKGHGESLSEGSCQALSRKTERQAEASLYRPATGSKETLQAFGEVYEGAEDRRGREGDYATAARSNRRGKFDAGAGGRCAEFWN